MDDHERSGPPEQKIEKEWIRAWQRGGGGGDGKRGGIGNCGWGIKINQLSNNKKLNIQEGK